MYKYVIMLALMLALIGTPALAYTPPSQGTDNATDVILWYSDNITIESANVTIDGGIDESIDNFTAMLYTMGFTLFIACMAFWRNEGVLYVVSGLLFMVNGFVYWATSATFSIALVVTGFMIFLRAFVRRLRSE